MTPVGLTRVGIEGLAVVATVDKGAVIERLDGDGNTVWSAALDVGRAIREAREKGEDPVVEAVKAVDGWLLFEGEIKQFWVEAASRRISRGMGQCEARGGGDDCVHDPQGTVRRSADTEIRAGR